jgi:hypothetical protein
MLYIENRFDARRSRTSFFLRAARELATAGDDGNGMDSVGGDVVPLAVVVGSGLEGSTVTEGVGAGLSTRE